MNPTPLSTIFDGDVTLGPGSDISQFGYGDLYVTRRGWFYGTEDSISPTSGTIVSYGGLGISLDAQFGSDINVLYGTSYLTSTIIDTTNGMVSVTGGNKVFIQVGDSSQFVTTGGSLTLSSLTDRNIIEGGLNSEDAVKISATDPSGGVFIKSGAGIGSINIASGSGGITGFCSSGNMNLTSNNGNTNIVNNTLIDHQDMSLELNGATDSQISIQSSGKNLTKPAIYINTTNTAGNINISNNNGLGNGSINVNTGTGGFNVTTNTGGNTNIITQGADANFLLNSSPAGQIMTIGINNTTDSAVVLASAGINTTRDAIQITTTNTSGNISIKQPPFSMGGVSTLTGQGGYTVITQTGGSIIQNAYGSTSTYTNSATGDFQDLTVSVTGLNKNSRVNIISEGIGTDAINIHSTGGIYGLSDGPITFDTTNTLNGINIATNMSNIPVNIGTPNSITTIFGDLDVKGTTTTIQSEIVTVTDNIVIVNNAPSGTANGGLGIKRWQSANNTGIGDVVIDTPDETGTLRNGNTATTVSLPFSSSSVNNYYSGWWIKITSGTGANQVRKIKSYDGANREATIYSSIDQTDPSVLNNTSPVEGMDYLTIPDNTSEYALYPCGYEFLLWNETANEFSFGCSPMASGSPLSHYANVHVDNLTVDNNISCSTINNSTADIITTFTLTNNSVVPVTITSFPKNYGVYTVMVEPIETPGSTPGLGTHAIFTIGRNNFYGSSGVVARLTSVKGVNGEQLDMQWPADNYPQIMYRPSKGINGTSDYKMKIISI